MKQVLLLTLYSLMSVVLYGQGFAVAADKMNEAYIGMDNPLTTIAEGYNCSQLVLTCDQGTLTKGEGCNYNFRPEQPGTFDITLSAKTKSGLKKIGVTKYRVKGVPVVNVGIAYQSGGKMNAEVFKQQKGLSVIFKDTELECKFRVTEFNIVLVGKKNFFYEEPNSGPLFNENILSQIKNLKPGDKVIIEKIKGVAPDSPRSISINSMVFTLN